MPSSRTRVRCCPKLRRLRKSPPLLPPALPALRWVALLMENRQLVQGVRELLGVVASNCSVLTAVIGVGELATSEMTREPVTTTLSVDSGVPCPAPRGLGLRADRRAEQTGKQCNNRYGGF